MHPAMEITKLRRAYLLPSKLSNVMKEDHFYSELYSLCDHDDDTSLVESVDLNEWRSPISGAVCSPTFQASFKGWSKSNQGDFVEYDISIYFKEGDISWPINKRYSDFHTLHK